MSLSTSRLAYTDCYELLDRAVEDTRGIRASVPTQAAATHLRMRIHQARAIDRSENAKTYAVDHPMHGRSPYDIFTVRIEESPACFWLYLDRFKVDIGVVEPIPEDHLIEAPKPVLQIEYQPKVEYQPAQSEPVIRRR